MPHLTPRRLLLLTAVLLLASTQLPLTAAQRVHAMARNVVDTSVAPVVSLLRGLSLTVRPEGARDIDYGSAETLRRNYAEALAWNSRLETEVRQLREKLDFYERTAGVLGEVTRRFVDARVARVIRNVREPQLVIAEGERLGIAPGQPVVSGVHLVGRVGEEVGPLSARVELLMRPGRELQARIRPPVARPQTPDFRELVTVTEDGDRLVCEVPLDQPVAVGDLVHLDDRLWPIDAQGFLLGQVAEIDDRVERPVEFKRLVIEPGIAPRRLARVTVLVEERGDP